MRRALLLLAAVCAAVVLPGSPALAHNQLTGSDPAGGATLTTAPTAVTLTFLQPLKPDFTTIVVSDAARQRVPAAAPVIDGGTGTITFTGALGNGPHTVAYRVVSTDGHQVQGSYTFTVADPALPAPPPSTAPAPAETGGGSSTMLGVLVGAGVVAVLAGGAYLIAARRRRA